MKSKSKKFISIVTPAFNEEKNLPILYRQIVEALEKGNFDWEWLIIDDHSVDQTLSVATALSANDSRVRFFRHARNFGSHAAIRCGLDRAQGDAAIVMASDLQDNPSLMLQLIERWKSGVHVVWATRDQVKSYSRVYYFIMRKIVGLHQMPEMGADFFLVDRSVIRVIRKFSETNVSIFALISWVGFKQESVQYEKKDRTHGKSGWTLEKKVKLLVDSITSFSYFPIRLMSAVGLTVALVGFIYALLILFNAFHGERPQGWASMMVVLLVVGGLQMLMMGVLGEYVWRALDESRHRPRYILESSSDLDLDA